MKNKLKSKDNLSLYLLVIIVLVCGLCNVVGGSVVKLQYVCLLVHFLIVIFAKKNDFLPIILFNHTCSGMYDTIGFTYLFNITIFICAIKLIFYNKFKFPKTILLLVTIFMYEISIVLINNYFTLGDFFSTISLFVSYIFILLCSKNIDEISVDKCYKYFLIGYIFSAISAFSIPFVRWGLNIPSAFRFTGYLRDPNYYSMDALLIMSISLILNRKFTKEYFLILLFGFFSISKMYLLLSITGFLLFIFVNIYRKKNKVSFQLFVLLMLIPIGLVCFSQTPMYKVFEEKYVYRSQTNSLFTGRDYIQSYYINKIVSEPDVLLLGKGLNYRKVLEVGHEGGVRYVDYAAHNTYLDFILSWGLIGSFLYIYMLNSINKQIKNKCENNKIISKEANLGYIIMLYFVLLGFFALSYMGLDFFAIMMLLVLICNPKNKVLYCNKRSEENE